MFETRFVFMKYSTLIISLSFVLAFAGYAQTDGERQDLENGATLRTPTLDFVWRLGDHDRMLTVLSPAGSSAEFAYTWQHNGGSLPAGANADGQVLKFDSLTFEHAGDYTCTAIELADSNHVVESAPMTVSVIKELPVSDRLPALIMATMFVLVVIAARYFRRDNV